ncbi:MAG: LPS assembly protein LptD [Candidatus Accumulibacter sp. UW20]|jgi:LPS-assembly protein
MKFPSRRKPLTLIFCCSFAGSLAASVAGEAHGQSLAPLRVDPSLLGLPPMPRAEPPARAQPGWPAAESRPVEAATVETRPMPAAVEPPTPTRAEIPTPEPVAPRVETPPAAAPQERAIRSAPREAVAEPSTARQTRAEAPALRSAPAPVVAPAVPAPAAVSAPATPASRGSPPALRMARTMQPPPAESDLPLPVFVSGQQISGQLEREVVAEGDAELRKVGTVLTADRLTYWPIDDEVDALGHVRLQQDGDLLTGSKGRLKLESQIGFIEEASYLINRQASAAGTRAGEGLPTKLPGAAAEAESTTGFAAPRVLDIKPGQTKLKTSDKSASEFTEARGEAERIDLEGENQIRMTAATYTTCPAGNDDWYLGVTDLKLDYDNDVGTGRDATVRFLDVPILYSPWLSFALNDERKSGFLVPSYGSSDTSGIEFSLPYYWNIAPNMDATIEPRILSKRGVQFGGDFRYVNEAYGGGYSGKTTVEYLPDDRQAGIDRWGVALNHSQLTANGFSAVINYNRVSDNDYYTDLSSQVTSTSQTQLLQQGVLSYGGAGWWTATANVQSFQTLQPDPQNPVSQPYRLLPQITVNARQPDIYTTDSAFFGQFTEFVHPDANMIEGQRTVLQPEISLPFVTPGWYVTPRVALNATHYSLSYPAGGVGSDSISRTLPIFSVDSGMTFERSSNWFGRDYTQTLEPRLFYLNIPYKNQDDIPVFDTALADFNFAQVFADNQFSGWDRINNANQLTTAVSSRLIDPSSGSEIMRGMLGQRFYFTDDKVTLPGTTQRKWDKSHFLAGFSGQVWPSVYTDAALQYDPGDQEFERYALGARYLPAPGRVLNATYSFNSQAAIPIKQIDFSGQWPISGRWQAVGRYNYSFLQDQPIEIIGGLEYNAGCWAVRTVVHRLQTSEADATTQFFVQLQLTGLASLGSNPLSLLQRRIPGYRVGSTPMDQGLAEW